MPPLQQTTDKSWARKRGEPQGKLGRAIMRKFLLAMTMIGPLAVHAQAANIPSKAPPATVSGAGWTGCYIGGQGGLQVGRAQHFAAADAVTLSGVATTPRYNIDGAMAGPELGCNWRAGLIVLGLESDWSWARVRGEASNIAPFNPSYLSRTEQRWLYTARARLGFSLTERVMLYLTGGAAWASFLITITNNVSATAEETKRRWGLVVGGGGEFAVTDNWSVKAEYLFLDFEKICYNDPNPNPSIFLPRELDVSHQHILRVGLNYRWWGDPISGPRR
jgi:outer membrane immunogenic protein